MPAKHEQELNQMQCSTRESPELNWDPVKVILLWGPPGCGKTYAARVLAGTSDHTFYELHATTVRGELVGQSEKNLQEVFKNIDDLKGKSIVFFEKADSLLWRRSSSNQHDIHLVDLFLAWTDGIRRKQLSVSSVWEMLSGNCTASHDCVMSPNFPANYDDYQHCTFQMLSPGPIIAERFDTENDLDILTVNGHQFSGRLESRDFEDIIPTGNIDWSSDNSNTFAGWKLCGHSKRATDTHQQQRDLGPSSNFQGRSHPHPFAVRDQDSFAWCRCRPSRLCSQHIATYRRTNRNTTRLLQQTHTKWESASHVLLGPGDRCFAAGWLGWMSPTWC